MLRAGRERTASDMFKVRPMTHADLKAAAEATNAAYGALTGRAPTEEPMFPLSIFELRFAADPRGCLVAVDDTGPLNGEVIGALFSVARASLGWFGPLAVRPEHQREGVAEALVAECLGIWNDRDLRLTGLETLPDAGSHLQFFERLGFRPAWTGIALRGPAWEHGMPAGVETGGQMPDLDYIYPGLDVYGEAVATTTQGAGQVLTTDDGVAIVHWDSVGVPDAGFVPFLAARTRTSFERLLGAAEHLVHDHGKEQLVVRTSGSAWPTLDALAARGYRTTGACIRLKAGEEVDYDRGEKFYVDSWL